MKNIRVFLSEIFQFLEMKFSIYLNRRVFVMTTKLDHTNSAHKNVYRIRQPIINFLSVV